MLTCGAKGLTTRTGRLEPGVANEGFTTFMVRPERTVQLDDVERIIYPLQSSAEGVRPSRNLFKTELKSFVNRGLIPSGKLMACCGHDLPYS